MRRLALSFACFLCFSYVVCAVQVDIQVRDSFSAGEQISFDYSIVSGKSERLYCLFYVACPGFYGLVEEDVLVLEADKPYKGTYKGYTVSDSFEPGVCSAVVELPGYELYTTRNFSIRVPPSFPFELRACRDLSCGNESSFFAVGSDVFLSYDPQADDLSFESFLVSPDGGRSRMEFPVAFKAEKVGEYVLDVTASKTGHKNETRSMRFFVINEPAKPVNAVICKADGICSGRENHSNCPQDCPPEEKDGICKAEKDGTCDPDCYEGVDPDCRSPSKPAPETTNTAEKKEEQGMMKYLPYFAILAAIVLAFILIHKMAGRKRIEKQREEFLRWKEEQGKSEQSTARP